MKLYAIFNEETKDYERQDYFDDCPINGTDVLPTDNFLKRKWDNVNNVWFESATPEEIEKANFEFTAIELSEEQIQAVKEANDTLFDLGLVILQIGAPKKPR